jgi:glutamate carboxypeptidase
MACDLETLCNWNSGSENLEGLHRTAAWLTEFFSELDVPVQSLPLPDFDEIHDSGERLTRSTGRALRWDLGQSSLPPERRVLWTIHYDTVYEASDRFQHCARLSDTQMRGPGVIDAKGGIVILRYAALAAKRFLDLSGVGLTLILTPDEEIGSPSSISLWREIASEFAFAMLFEPTLASGAMVAARKGTGTYTFVVRGRSAHSGRNFAAGRNAVVVASRIAVECHELNGQRDAVTINVGRIRGGQAVNVVPDCAVVRVNIRVTDAADQAWVESQMQAIAMRWHAPEDGIHVELHGGITSPPKPRSETLAPWIDRVERAGERLGQNIAWSISGGASDGNKLQSLGLPNLDTFGPEGDALHSDQEWISLPSLPQRAELAVTVLADWITSLEAGR